LKASQMVGMDCSESAEEVKHLFLNSLAFPERVGHILQAKVKVLNEELTMVDGRILERDYIPIIFQNKYKGHLWHYRDITSRKQVELALKAAKEEAEESNRLKTIFLGNLSHEVRTPLQGILGFAEILENASLSETKRLEYINIIKQRTGDMQNIIESLLDMASLETGEIRAFPVALNLYEAVEHIFTKTKQDHHLKGRPLTLTLENTLSPVTMVMIDPQHLAQVLSNLMNNAVKFTSTGTITLVSTQTSSCFQISVKDTGVGIPEDKIHYIFEPFRQAHEGMSRSKGGIGLGLAICKKMVEMWGGQIQVQSQPGIGSTFSFTIPFFR
jgi:signal transduction histidine kinase